MGRSLVTAGLVAVLLSAGLAWADPPSDRVAAYTIVRNGSVIGSHAVRFQAVGDRVVVQHRVRIRVDILVFNAYSYDLESREDWRSDRLVRMTARTNKNGTPLSVSARLVGAGLRVQATERTGVAPVGAVPASPSWNVLSRRPDRMIDAETGEILRVRVSAPRPEGVRLGARTVPCQRFDVSGGLDATLWYGPSGVLVKKRLTAPDDSTVVTLMRPSPRGEPP